MSTITTERELLELAAKAAGMTGMHWGGTSMGMLKSIDPSRPGKTGSVGFPWRPLDDDGDALRLAVKLRINVEHNHPADQQTWVSAHRNGCEGCFDPVSCIESDFDESGRGTATRRSIVRAAAAIGRAMS